MRPLVIVPTYNERENLPKLLGRLLDIPNLSVLVVDDDSPDGTGVIADDLAASSDGRVSVLHRQGPRGLGRAYLDGIRHALHTDADVVRWTRTCRISPNSFGRCSTPRRTPIWSSDRATFQMAGSSTGRCVVVS